MSTHAAELIKRDWIKARKEIEVDGGTLALSRHLKSLQISRASYYQWRLGRAQITAETARKVERCSGERLKAINLLNLDDLHDKPENLEDDPLVSS